MTEYESYYYVVAKGKRHEIYSLSYKNYEHFRFSSFESAQEFLTRIEKQLKMLAEQEQNEKQTRA